MIREKTVMCRGCGRRDGTHEHDCHAIACEATSLAIEDPEIEVEVEDPRSYTRRCEGYVYFGDQGIEVCEECGGCTCCDHAAVDHRNARYRCLIAREGAKCLLVGNARFNHDCARDQLP